MLIKRSCTKLRGSRPCRNTFWCWFRLVWEECLLKHSFRWKQTLQTCPLVILQYCLHDALEMWEECWQKREIAEFFIKESANFVLLSVWGKIQSVRFYNQKMRYNLGTISTYFSLRKIVTEENLSALGVQCYLQKREKPVYFDFYVSLKTLHFLAFLF